MSEPVDYYVAGLMFWLDQNGKEYFTRAEIKNWGEDVDGAFETYVKPHLVDDDLLQVALSILHRDGVITIVPDKFGPEICKVERNVYLDDLRQGSIESVLDKVAHFGEEWIVTALKNIEKSGDYIENTPSLEDDVWQPLPIDREKPEYHEVVEATEEAINAIHGENGPITETPEEKEAILNSARSTLENIKNGVVTKAQAYANLVKPFEAITSRLKEGITKEAVSKASKAIVQWLATVVGLA